MRYFMIFFVVSWSYVWIQSEFWVSRGMPYHVPQPHCGDMARMGALFDVGDCRVEERPDGRDGFIPLEFIGRPGDIQFTTIFGGDSFARGRASGPDNYFQSMYARSTGESVTYINDVGEDQYSSYAPVLESGVLTTLGAKRFFLIMSEKSAGRAFGRDKDFAELAARSPRSHDEVISFRKQVDQMGYMDPNHIEASKLLSLISTHEEFRAAAVKTYALYSVFWQPWSEIVRANALLSDTILRSCEEAISICQNKIVELHREFSLWFANDPFTKIALANHFSGMAGQVLLRQASRFDIKYSARSTYRYVCNVISKKLLDSYLCDDQLLFQARLTEKGRGLFSKNVLIEFVGNQKAMLDMRHAEIRENIRINLEEFACEFERRGIHFIVTIVPSRLYVYEDYIEDDYRTPDALFDAMNESMRCGTYVDLAAVGRRAAAEGQSDLYYYDDTHWSPRFQRLLMDYVEQNLLQSL